MTSHDPDPLERLLAERACERLILEFVRRLDLGDPSTVCDLFTPDGTWEWPHDSRRVEGREALRAYFGSRPSRSSLAPRLHQHPRHRRLPRDGHGHHLLRDVPGRRPHRGNVRRAPSPANIGHYEDTFRKADGTWLLATRTLHLAFGGPTERLTPLDRPA